jgi:hypothetical protein
MSLWSDLPNAHHIDRVIASVKKHPKIWDAALSKNWNVVWDATYNAAYGAAWAATRDAGLVAVRNAVWREHPNPSQNAIMALIVYDDCANYLVMPSEELHAWALLSENPAAVLLLPAVIAFEQIEQLAET